MNMNIVGDNHFSVIEQSIDGLIIPALNELMPILHKTAVQVKNSMMSITSYT